MKHRTYRRMAAVAAVLTLTGAFTATTVLTAAPAQAAAAESCTGWQHKEFPTSGVNEINANSSGGPKRCFGGADTSPRDGGWTADGYVAYNLDDDGEGGKTWSLRGSPQIN